MGMDKAIASRPQADNKIEGEKYMTRGSCLSSDTTRVGLGRKGKIGNGSGEVCHCGGICVKGLLVAKRNDEKKGEEEHLIEEKRCKRKANEGAEPWN